jgi:hypothetical protein
VPGNGNTCPENPGIVNQLNICVAPEQRPAAGGCGACLPQGGEPNVCPAVSATGKCCSTLSEAVRLAVRGDTIGVFGPTFEPAVKSPDDVGPNVIIDNGAPGFSGPFGSPFRSNLGGGNPLLFAGLRIEECHDAKINAGNPLLPVIDIQPGAGQIIINGIDVIGGTAGILAANSGTSSQRGAIVKGIRANNNITGIEVTGNFNEVSGSIATANETGIQVSGSNNLIRSNKANSNTEDGFFITGNLNDLRGNEANTNGEVGFDITGSSNMLRSNQSNRSPQGGAKENGDCEYSFANSTTQDFGGNKKDNLNFIGTIPGSPRRYAQGCYE